MPGLGSTMKRIIAGIMMAAMIQPGTGAAPAEAEVLVDSAMTLEAALEGTDAPAAVIAELVLLDVRYLSFDGKIHQGQLLIHRELEEDLRNIFALILALEFPLGKAVPIARYRWSDEASMADGNTSAFCYRFIAGTGKLSNHASGRAIDINPRQNPVIHADGRVEPAGTRYDPAVPGTLFKEHPVVREFLKRGWRWGGDYVSFKDYHHFEKR